MKKLLILLGTILGAFLFAFAMSTSVYADELPVDDTTTTETKVIVRTAQYQDVNDSLVITFYNDGTCTGRMYSYGELIDESQALYIVENGVYTIYEDDIDGIEALKITITDDGFIKEYVEDDKKTLDDILGIELTDEQVEKIIDTIGKYTNEDVKNLSVSVYVAFGVSGLILLLLVIVLVVVAIKYGRKNEFTNAILNKCVELIDETQKTNYKELVEKVDDNNEKVFEMYKELLSIVAEKKTSKIAEKTAKLDEVLNNVSVSKVE